MKKIAFVIAIAMLFAGCSTKQDDSTAEKVAKHTVNAPFYLVVGVGGVATKAKELAGGLVAAPFVWASEQADSNSTDSNSTSLDQNVTGADANNTINVDTWEENNNETNTN